LIVDWRSQLSEALGANIPEPLAWDEASEDYCTARPDWDRYGSLILWAAYDDHRDLRPPPRFTELSTDPADDAPLEQAAMYAFSDMLTLAELACSRRMPMKLDD
jgi:hypothetical protein